MSDAGEHKLLLDNLHGANISVVCGFPQNLGQLAYYFGFVLVGLTVLVGVFAMNTYNDGATFVEFEDNTVRGTIRSFCCTASVLQHKIQPEAVNPLLPEAMQFQPCLHCMISFVFYLADIIM